MIYAYFFLGTVVGLAIAWFVQKRNVTRLKRELTVERETVSALRAGLARSEAEISHRDATMMQYRADLESVQEKFTAAFENLANRILEERTAKLKSENASSLGQLLDPLRQQITDFRQRVDAIHTAETSDRSALRTQVKELTTLNQQVTTEAKNLTTALKGQVRAQGVWGELILESILEKSGLVKNSEYTVHASFTTSEGRRALPDIVINLPGAKHIVVDAKVSLTAYEKYCSCESDPERDAALKEHLISVKKHVRELSGKNYSDLYQIASPDFVLLFMPIESALSLAWQADPQLVPDAFESNVVIVTASTLMATLRTITNIWRREKQTRNVLEIARQGGALYDQFVRFYEDLNDLGQHLRKAEEAYASARDRLKTGKGSLAKRAEDLRKLGARTSKSLPLDMTEEADEDIDVTALADGEFQKTAIPKESSAAATAGPSAPAEQSSNP
ncbi:MAG: DNA recombination protein RmuC [Chthoniobacterales bacterium]|nr:MAG: DNA recombination protein RmuC [Chthoniobacterales bacterium]